MRIMRIPMARLNITIADELYDALEKWRDRLNISRVCQEAIAREVAKLEELPRAAAELEALVERLHQEKAVTERFWFAQGVTDGIAWTRGAPYAELRRWGELGAVDQAGDDGGSRALETARRRYAKQADFDDKALMEGWLAGVREVWQRVKDRV